MSFSGSILKKFEGFLKPLGLVFGDIGTSPIYTLPITFLLVKNTPQNVIGIISLIVWTLTLLVLVQYSWLAMSLGHNGQGGTIALKENLIKYLQDIKQRQFINFLVIIGISLLIGDGVITPAISILSAVEGLLIIPGLENTSQMLLVIIASIIAIGLFSFQCHGTEKVSKTFGPIMLVWFICLALSGICFINKNLNILNALNPYYAINFLMTHGFQSLMVLSAVFLCATGSEGLFADMGHLGRKPIIKSWCIVFVVLIINYLGQGAYLIDHPKSKFALFEMVYILLQPAYIPFLILSILSTVIASQGMISAGFSVVYQAITTRIMPMLKIDYTSPHLRSQIYIGVVNWFLLICVLLIMFIFKESNNLGVVYGFAVAGTMTITGSMITMTFWFRKQKIHFTIALLILLVDLLFLISNALKIPHGGYWSIIIASIPFGLIITYNLGQKTLYKFIGLSNKENFLSNFIEIYKSSNKISGTALFFARDVIKVPPYILRTMFVNNIIYEDNIFISIIVEDEPFGVDWFFKEPVTEGLRIFEIHAGYMEVLDIEEIILDAEINAKSIFYGVEEIVTTNIILKVFSLIKKVSPSFVQFYRLPINKVHGVVTRVNM